MFYNSEESFIDKFIACLKKLSVTEIPFDNNAFYNGIEQMRQYFQNNRSQIQHAFEIIDTDLDAFSKYVPLVLQAVYLSEEYEWYTTELKKYLFDKLTEEYALESVYRISPSPLASDILNEYLA